MSKENYENKDPMQEVLAAIGAWTMHHCQGNAGMADESGQASYNYQTINHTSGC